MDFFIRAYLRASTEEQDAFRAKEALDAFVAERDLTICSYYVENESGAKLRRPELFRLLDDCKPEDVLLVEDVERLSRLNDADWNALKGVLSEKKIRLVAVNVPTTWNQLDQNQNEFDRRIFEAINNLMVDMLAAIARKDYLERRRKQQQGIKKAKAAGKYRGRPANLEAYASIKTLLDNNMSWSQITKTLGCSRTTIQAAKQYYLNLDERKELEGA